MSDFMVENVLQAAVWSILKQIAANRKLKNKSKGVDTLYQSARITTTRSKTLLTQRE